MKAFLRVFLIPIVLILLWLIQAQQFGYSKSAILVGIFTAIIIPSVYLVNKLMAWLYKE